MILNPYFWGALALAALLGFFGGCGVQKDRDADRWDQHIAADKAADQVRQQENAEYRSREKVAKVALVDIRKQRDKALTDGKKAADDLRADLLARPERVREHWRVRKCDLPKDSAADGSGESAAGLQAASIGRVSGIGSEAEADYAFIVQRYLQAEKVCGTLTQR